MLGASGQRKVSEGWRASELVGLDEDATGRCITVVARHIRSAIDACGGRPADGACIFGYYSGGTRPSTDKRIIDRWKTLAKVRSLAATPPELTPEEREASGF
jgi:hypothetical protein